MSDQTAAPQPTPHVGPSGSTADPSVKDERKYRSAGYVAVQIWNCHTDHMGVNVYSWDYTGGGGWQHQGFIPSQYVGSGCGSTYSPPGATIHLQDGHYYRLLVLDKCNDPMNMECVRAYVDVQGGTMGGIAPWTIG